MIHPRIAIAVLGVSASALVGIAVQEDYRGEAYIPVKGDVPTLGFGETKGVKPGDKTDPVRALVRLQASADQYAAAVKRCAPVPMHQHEFDAATSLTYNIGEGAYCRSSMAAKFRAGDYAGACAEIKRWTFFNGRDCKVRANRCYGLVTRRESEYNRCMGAA